ncbi:hypothetical protein Ancab_001557 [Ancistrocladus abbreviatus]
MEVNDSQILNKNRLHCSSGPSGQFEPTLTPRQLWDFIEQSDQSGGRGPTYWRHGTTRLGELRRRCVGELHVVGEVVPFVGGAFGSVRFVWGLQFHLLLLLWVYDAVYVSGLLLLVAGALLFCVCSGVAPLPGPTAFKDFLGLARKSFGAVRLAPVSFLF